MIEHIDEKDRGETMSEDITRSDMITEIYPQVEFEKILPQSISLINTESVEFIGSNEQVVEMLSSWTKYLAAVKNPATNKENTFFKVNGKNSKYAPLDEVLNTIKPCLTKYGFSFIQVPTVSSEFVSTQLIMMHSNGGIMNFPKFTIKTEKLNAQNIGSVLTYARRYQLGAICGIAGELDDDGNSASGNEEKQKVQKKESSPIKTELLETCKAKAKINREKVVEVLSKYGDKDGLVASITNESEMKKAIVELNNIKENA